MKSSATVLRENVAALDLEKIAFRMKDKAFFECTLARRAAHIPFDAVVVCDLSQRSERGA